ncbi:MAG TPA: RHS repeat-associated core domain-containing protein [Gemmataceae bacterium]|nr:RHS repeat-associated core domain-containing protein [Gemmataceae bacterium]
MSLTTGAAGHTIRFQGQQEDAETGLHYNRYRYYDPAMGRFISMDPIGLRGGLNVWRYGPNPTQWLDPLGLTGSDASGRPLSSSHYSIWTRIKLPCDQLSKVSTPI